jgi:uncharacterized membrane protein YecN with MAPEG domain
MRRGVRNAFWPIEEALVVAYLFVIVFGAVRPGEILPVTVVGGVLLVAWLVHAWTQRRS